MACCGEYDPELAFLDQPQFALNCIMDSRETACYSAVHALIKERNSLPNGGRKDAVDEILSYLHTDQGLTECIAGLGDSFPVPIIFNSHSAEWVLDHTWVTTDLYGAELSYAVAISSVSWPEYDYPNLMETCNSLGYNNLMVFDDTEPPLEYQAYATLEEADGTLDGPLYGSGYIESFVGFASTLNSCDEPLCSHISLSENSIGDWSIDDMALFVDGYFIIDNGSSAATMDRGYLELSGPARGTWEEFFGVTTYEIAVGDAVFMAGGASDAHTGFLTAYNSTPIKAVYITGEWSFSTFDLEYNDPFYGTFVLTVDASTWLEE